MKSRPFFDKKGIKGRALRLHCLALVWPLLAPTHHFHVLLHLLPKGLFGHLFASRGFFQGMVYAHRDFLGHEDLVFQFGFEYQSAHIRVQRPSIYGDMLGKPNGLLAVFAYRLHALVAQDVFLFIGFYVEGIGFQGVSQQIMLAHHHHFRHLSFGIFVVLYVCPSLLARDLQPVRHLYT